MLNLISTGAGAISHTTDALDYQLIITTCLLHEIGHVSSLYITTGPGTDSSSPGDIKLLNQSVPVFWWTILLHMI